MKSLVGNVGFFDMTDPNIYKSLLPIGLGLGAASQIEQKKQGGKIKTDPQGYWNPENINEPILNIPSNYISMENIPFPILGISDEGDTKVMHPNKKYKFKGKNVKEIPLMQQGGQVYKHSPGKKGLYEMQRTISPYKTKKEIKNKTQIPSNAKEVDFIHNYAGALGHQNAEDFDYPTSAPYEGDKHWNIDRFVINAHNPVSFYGQDIPKQSLKDSKKDVLYDMYKYNLLQNKDRDTAFKEAQSFVKKEYLPRMRGAYANKILLNNHQQLVTTNVDKFADENPFLSVYANKDLDFYKNAYVPTDRELTRISKDYLKDFRKMDKKSANELIKSWKNEKKNYIKQVKSYPPFKFNREIDQNPIEFQTGGQVRQPIRGTREQYQAYQDSLNSYNATKQYENVFPVVSNEESDRITKLKTTPNHLGIMPVGWFKKPDLSFSPYYKKPVQPISYEEDSILLQVPNFPNSYSRVRNPQEAERGKKDYFDKKTGKLLGTYKNGGKTKSDWEII